MRQTEAEGSAAAHARTNKCPDNTAFYQQRLPAWRPTLAAKPVLTIFFGIGIFCLAVGVAWIVSVSSVQEIKINYSDSCTHCSKLRENSSNYDKKCYCSVNFTLQEAMQGDVFMYYGLQNFHQNHRRYGMSRYDEQLLGKDVYSAANKINFDSQCQPFARYADGTPMAPCGAIANSMFNDTIHVFYHLRQTAAIEVPLEKTGNNWWSDKNVKFENPSPMYNLLQAFNGTRAPPYWQKPVYSLDTSAVQNNGFKNEDFIIWMRVAAFPSFRKLYRRLNRINQFADGLPPGTYSCIISYNYVTSRFRGTKHLILTTMTWCGGSSLFLGIAYTATGAATVLTAIAMLAVHLKYRKKLTYFQQQAERSLDQ